MLFRNIPHTLTDARLGLLVILLIVAGGAMWLYNAYRLGRLPWKPKGPANAKLVCAVILLGIILVPVLAVLLT